MMQSSILYALRQEFNGELQMVRSQERVYLLILILFLLKLVRLRRKIERSITGTRGGRTQHWPLTQMALGMDGRVWNTKAGPYAQASDKKLYKSSTVPQILLEISVYGESVILIMRRRRKCWQN